MSETEECVPAQRAKAAATKIVSMFTSHPKEIFEANVKSCAQIIAAYWEASAPVDFPAILERERTLVAEGVTNVKEAIKCREWLTEGRGSYEWNDDRWHGEFAAAIKEILAALQPLERIAADWTNCPQKWEDVQKARAELKGKAWNAAAAAPPQDAKEK